MKRLAVRIDCFSFVLLLFPSQKKPLSLSFLCASLQFLGSQYTCVRVIYISQFENLCASENRYVYIYISIHIYMYINVSVYIYINIYITLDTICTAMHLVRHCFTHHSTFTYDDTQYITTYT